MTRPMLPTRMLMLREPARYTFISPVDSRK
jgi:hypothetical protein